MKFILLTFSFFTIHAMIAQNLTESNAPTPTLPYYEIPAYPETYSPGNVVARMMDGLGYRYYWATEGLRTEDLAHKPSEDARTALETLDHIHSLTRTTLNAVKKVPNIRNGEKPKLTFEELRTQTLENIKMTSDLLKAGKEGEMEEYKIIFQRGEKTSEYPFWNLLNGPIADAMWHVGQIVSLRRASGNPLDPRVSVFRGKIRE